MTFADYRNRVYSTEFGRFFQVDPIRFKAGDINIYRYVNNNPTVLTDPYGKSWLLLAGIGIALGLENRLAVDWACGFLAPGECAYIETSLSRIIAGAKCGNPSRRNAN